MKFKDILNKGKSIGPREKLPIGTKVTVGNKFGKVIKVDEDKDQFGQPIMVHTVKYEKIWTAKGPRGSIFKPYTKESQVNYAGINVIPWKD